MSNLHWVWGMIPEALRLLGVMMMMNTNLAWRQVWTVSYYFTMFCLARPETTPCYGWLGI
jgi:hypothetical protein